MDLGLKNKLAVITGGSVGIGLAVAQGFAAEGARVLITARNEARVMAEAALLKQKFGVDAVGIAADVATAAGCASVIAAAAEMGGVRRLAPGGCWSSHRLGVLHDADSRCLGDLDDTGHSP
jgi:3-oxoacyl-[acyl-carrier protein] reductase